MKNTLTLMTLLLIAAFPACSFFSPGCFIQDQAVSISTNVIVDQLQCVNADAVHASMKDLIGKAGLCDIKDMKTGPLADTLCPLVSAQVTQFVASNAIPVVWGCSAANAKDKLGVAITEACKKLPVTKIIK